MTINFKYQNGYEKFSLENPDQYDGEDRSGRDMYGVTFYELSADTIAKLSHDIHYWNTDNPIKKYFPHKPYQSYNTPDHMTQEEAKVLYEKEKYGTLRKKYLFNLAYGRYHKALAKCYDPMTEYGYRIKVGEGWGSNRTEYKLEPTKGTTSLYTPYKERRAIRTEISTKWENDTLLEALEAYSEKLEKEIGIVHEN